MECLEKYRRGLVREANRQLRGILDSADATAVHDFRVAIKRLTAIYRFLQQIDEQLPVKQWLQPCRDLFKRGGRIRDAQIAIGLIDEAVDLPRAARQALLGPLRASVRSNYRQFQRYARAQRITAIRLPSIAATGLERSAISRHRPAYFQQLHEDICCAERGSGKQQWHRKRILLKRYHHMLDAFALCPGYGEPPSLLKQIVLLEQLLGDWHDRVVAVDILRSLPRAPAEREALIRRLNNQQRLLLGSAKIYLAGFARAQGDGDQAR